MSSATNNEVVARLRAKLPGDADIEIPPKVFVDMGGELLRYEEDEALTARFPVRERYQNPMGYMQGGMIVAAIDNTLGPLSYLVAPPSVTTQLNTSFIRPLGPDDAHVTVRGWVVERAGRQLFLAAQARTDAGKTVALSQATCQIVNRGRR